MRKLFISSLLLIFWSSILSADTIKKIEITGNKRVSKETIKIYGDIDINKNYDEKELNKVLTNLYSTNFFESVELNISNNILKINLIEYPVINQLIILGEPKKKIVEEINKLMLLKKKGSYIKSNLSKDVETIKKLYASIGHNFTKVSTKIREIDKSNLDIIFEINKGNKTKISKIVFTGDKKVREKRLRDIIASEEDKFWKVISRNTNFSQNLLDLDKRLLENYYKSIGYYDVKINSRSAEVNLESSNVEITYSIDAGKRYFINKIETNTDPVFDKDIFFPLNKQYQKIVGSYYSPFKVKKILEEIDSLIASNNLQFVEHNVQESIEGDSINIKFNIYEGEKVLIERINIYGNSVTNESVIRAELLIDEGDPFTKLGLDKSISNIKSRNIFSSVTEKVSNGSSNDLKIIDINVEERATGEISAGAGVGTNGASFQFTIKENNWLGEGKNVGVSFDVDQQSIKGSISYQDPNYDFLGNSIYYSLSSINNDKPDQGYENTLTSASISTTFEQYKDLYATLGTSFSYDDLKTEAKASDSLKKQNGKFTEISGDYGFSLDKRNRSFMPTDGYYLSFAQSLPVYADKSFVDNKFNASLYNTLSENIIGAVKFQLSVIEGIGGDDVRLSKRKFVSNRKLRGFEAGRVGPIDGEDHVGGNYATTLNFEANLPNLLPESTKTDIGLFLDFGNIWGVDYDPSLSDSNELRSATGVAASWISPLGPMTFILSTNIAKASTDKTETFNFNLGTTF